MVNAKKKISGYFSWEIFNEKGKLIKKSKEKNNLILNQGLDYLSVYWFAECFAYCAIGGGDVAPLLTDTGLLQESKRTGKISSSTYFIQDGVINIRRVFDFDPEVQTQFYGELGWSPEATAGNNLFSKSLMIDQNGNVGKVQTNRLQFLRVTYTLQISVDPAELTVSSPQIANWTTDGFASSQYVGLVGLTSTGIYTFIDGAKDAAEPKNNNIDIFISTGRATPSGLGTGANYLAGGSIKSATVSAYESGSYSKIFSTTFSRGTGVGQISTIGCGLTGSSLTVPIYAHLMNSPQTKATDYELSVYFNYQWGRA